MSKPQRTTYLPYSSQALIAPIFVRSGNNLRLPIQHIPDYFIYSPDILTNYLLELVDLGVKKIALFELPEIKKEAPPWPTILPELVANLKARFPALEIICDLCVCQYLKNGQCVLIQDGKFNNDLTVNLLCQQAINLAEAGVDYLMPSSMLDGIVISLRKVLDQAALPKKPQIISQSVKYASALYAPFRFASKMPSSCLEKAAYQIDLANQHEALRCAKESFSQGADILMVKPGIFTLDLVSKIERTYNQPVAIFSASAEYSMLMALAQTGSINLEEAILELFNSYKRAGADLVLSYFVPEYLGVAPTSRSAS